MFSRAIFAKASATSAVVAISNLSISKCSGK
jgi:hypothetical protein